MLLLVLDTATPAVSVALFTPDEGLISQRVTIDGRAHAELLAPQIDAVLREAGIKPAGLSAIAAGVGPGPFTGLRVGLMTAATMAAALGIPTYGVCTLDALGAATAGRTLVATDARRREVYWALYEDGKRRTDPAVDKPAELAPRLAEWGITAGVGEGAAKYADVLGVVAGDPLYPPLDRMAALAASGVPADVLTPLYLRRPDAVERKVS